MRELLVQTVYQYDDYRRFLDDYFTEQKKMRATFSHRFFARKAGFSSSSFFLSVVKGRFNLSEQASQKVVQAIEMDAKQASFFKALVRYNQSRRKEEREIAWNEVQQIRRTTEYARLSTPQHEYFSHWYYPVIREIAPLDCWEGDELKLARMLEPQISTEVAREALVKLVEWNLLRKDEQGKYHFADQLVSAEGVSPLSLRTIKREFLENGISALDRMSAHDRFITFSTLGMSEKSYQYAIQVLNEAREKIMTHVAADSDVDKVCELIVQLFPLSKSLKREAK